MTHHNEYRVEALHKVDFWKETARLAGVKGLYTYFVLHRIWKQDEGVKFKSGVVVRENERNGVSMDCFSSVADYTIIRILFFILAIRTSGKYGILISEVLFQMRTWRGRSVQNCQFMY